MIFFCILVLGLFLSLIAQQFIPPLAWLEGARVLILPVVMFYGALALPYAGMLALAFISGFMMDAVNTQVIDSQVEISLGWSILLYGALGAIMSGFRPLFLRGRWEVHCLVSGLLTSVIVLAQYLMITIRRGGFIFPVEVWWRIGGAGLIAAMLAPVFFFSLNWLAPRVGYEINPETKGLN
jgi:hypothetical protein